MAKPVLGRGLGALLGGSPATKPAAPTPPNTTVPVVAAEPSGETGERVRRVPIGRVCACPFQPRKTFSSESLKELADSIKEQGIVQPLIVREQNGKFEIIAGERRWRAAQLQGLAEVPVIVRQADDRAVLEMALIENLQRENLNPIEEAQGYSQLIEQFKLTQEEAATKVGKGRVVVANSLRLLKLAPTVQTYVREGRLSVGHAKAVLGLDEHGRQASAAERVLKEGLNVRQTEAMVARLQARQTITAAAPPAAQKDVDPHVARLEDKLRQRLGTKVHLRYAQGKGTVEIAFFSDAELERILSLLGVEAD